MKFRTAIMAATILASPIAAQAQPINGLYIGGAIGGNYQQNEQEQLTSAGGGGTAHVKSRIGPAAALSLGYGLGNGLRVELEGLYTENTFYKADGGTTNAGGQEQKFGPLVNVLYDFNGLGAVVPYVGVGGGYVWAKETNLHVAAPTFLASANNGTKGDFAAQGILGVAFPVPNAPGLSVTADYRFLALVGDRNYSGTATSGGHTASANFKSNEDYNHSVLIGLRYAFGAPAPAPMAAPVAAAVAPSPISRSYIVFFDWDKADLTDRARQIVAEAATNSTKVQYTQLQVNGYTDTSGTPQYNQGLSIRRAEAVAGELVKDGVPKSAIAIQGFGETHLLVPTAAGIKEPQNRRVEIIIK